MSDLTTVELVLLAALSDRARYGYQLVGRMAELTDDRLHLRPGNLYRVLQRLMERGLVRETAHAGTADDERRRYFRATAEGRRLAAEELAMYGMVLRRTPSLRDRLAGG